MLSLTAHPDHTPAPIRTRLLALLAALILLPTTAATTQSHDLLTRRITITAEPTTLSVAETITLTVRDRPISRITDATITDPMALDWPALRAAINGSLPTGLTLTAGPTPLPRDPLARTFEIEPLTPGSFTIPPIQLTLTIDSTKLHDSDTQADQHIDPMSIVGSHMAALEQQSVLDKLRATTEPITITVRSVFADDESPALAELRGIAEPRWPFPWRAAAIAAAVLLITTFAAIYFIAAHRRRRETKILTIPADTLAHQQLHAVLALGDLEAQRYRLLLERVSAVLRGYLEDRFKLRAPELTTAEFLREAEANALTAGALTPNDRATLGEFLSRIDMIKYAGANASRTDAEQAIEAVRAFINRTADPEATLIIQRGRHKVQSPGAAARLLRALEQTNSSPNPHPNPTHPGGTTP